MTPDRNRFDPGRPRPFSGVGDPRYLLGELLELKELSSQTGLGTLAYLIDRAARDARWQAESAEWVERECRNRDSDGASR
jgi:hypothetical protein